MIIYSDKTLKSWQGGRQFWFLAIIRPEHRGKRHIVEHEKEHIRQWWAVTATAAIALAVVVFGAIDMGHLLWRDEYFAVCALPPSLHGILYLASKRYRLWAEVRAYRVSLRYRPESLDHYARTLSEKYGLNITAENAKELLKWNG
ncbi:MAG TPA: hypothetical protein VFV43_09100 [Limnobacter sp.]|nr:hypothetical protein [Limnobacter sp.]